jgi:hypothetical protein
MPPAVPDSRRLDERTWSVATRSSPIVIQLVIAVALLATWLLGRWSVSGDVFTHSLGAAVLVAVGLTAIGSFNVAAALFLRDSATARGVGLSAAACAAVALIGAIPYAIWLL